eukprot:TRINITY_DN14118_c0_g1_i1.p1 TRINITY_DN14118_c0_g1~~TRINITY_DN14118_c0_g1_i1.p1  ORF type:complete len:352 (-),score=81.10 TRINITY_DN14118_c0_g1_i1:15-1070(-)
MSFLPILLLILKNHPAVPFEQSIFNQLFRRLDLIEKILEKFLSEAHSLESHLRTLPPSLMLIVVQIVRCTISWKGIPADCYGHLNRILDLLFSVMHFVKDRSMIASEISEIFKFVVREEIGSLIEVLKSQEILTKMCTLSSEYVRLKRDYNEKFLAVPPPIQAGKFRRTTKSAEQSKSGGNIAIILEEKPREEIEAVQELKQHAAKLREVGYCSHYIDILREFNKTPKLFAYMSGVDYWMDLVQSGVFEAANLCFVKPVDRTPSYERFRFDEGSDARATLIIMEEIKLMQEVNELRVKAAQARATPSPQIHDQGTIYRKNKSQDHAPANRKGKHNKDRRKGGTKNASSQRH